MNPEISTHDRNPKKRHRSPSSSNEVQKNKRKKSKKHKKKHNSDSSSDDSDRRKKKLLKIAKRLKKKSKNKDKGNDISNNVKDIEKKGGEGNERTEDDAPVDIPISLMSKSLAPLTKEQWEKQQSVVRKVYDESTGRHRLIKGDGEVIEEIVSKERHKAINQQATKGDGDFFQANVTSRINR